jgi:ribosomal-protein-alanine N-acetyltransferase
MKVEIVPMKHSHLDQMAELEKVCFSMPWSRDMLADELGNKHAVYYIAEADDDRVAGYIGMHMVLDEGYITNVATAPEFRRKGVASSLIRKIIERCGTEKLIYVTLEVRESNSGAIDLYQKFGFKKIGKRTDYYQKPREDALIMFLTL